MRSVVRAFKSSSSTEFSGRLDPPYQLPYQGPRLVARYGGRYLSQVRVLEPLDTLTLGRLTTHLTPVSCDTCPCHLSPTSELEALPGTV